MVWTIVSIGIAILAIAAGCGFRWRRRQRDRLYAELAAQWQPTVSQHAPSISQDERQIPELATRFSQDHLAWVGNYVSAQTLEQLRQEALATFSQMEKSFIPLHKKGHTLSYERVQRLAPGSLGFYHSPEVQKWVSGIVGQPIFPTPVQDQSSLSLLCYREEGDHINWHYDHNFYRGRHFTVLLSVANEGPPGRLSQSCFQHKVLGQERVVPTPPGTLLLFEGARVLHRATPTAAGDLRIMLSMTYSADPRISRFKEMIRRVKDTAFFGIRALWD